MPESHAVQASGPVADVLAEYFPAVHSEHVDESAIEYDPAGQESVITSESVTGVRTTEFTGVIVVKPEVISFSVTVSDTALISYVASVAACAFDSSESRNITVTYTTQANGRFL